MTKLLELVRKLTGAEIPGDNANALGYWARVADLSIEHGNRCGGMVLEFRQGWLQADLELAEERAK